jgi:aerobic C4-dicarboxylate transport protein
LVLVGLVFPASYSFYTDSTNIYLTLPVLFLAQAMNTLLVIGQTLRILIFAMIVLRGASGVTGTGFVTLATILAAVPAIPMQSPTLLVGIDRFRSGWME